MSQAVSHPRGLVLIVEDSADGAESLSLVLGLSGFDIRVAHTGTAGVRLACECRPHAVVCDIGLPDLDGFGVAQALRQNPDTAGIRLIALTAYSDEATRSRARACGFDDFLVKPADPQALLEVLANRAKEAGAP